MSYHEQRVLVKVKENFAYLFQNIKLEGGREVLFFVRAVEVNFVRVDWCVTMCFVLSAELRLETVSACGLVLVDTSPATHTCCKHITNHTHLL